MLKKTRNLILVDAKEIEFEETKQGRKTGNKIKKWKYTFFDKDLTVFEGYDTDGFFKDQAVDMEEMKWDDTKAHMYAFEIKIFDGKTTEQLIAGSVDGQ